MRFLSMASTLKQPDLHHEGELTAEFVVDLLAKIKVALDQLILFEPPDMDVEWILCKANWAESLRYAGLRCAAIASKLECGVVYQPEDDRKCIDITLCILRDFEEAKAKGFERADNQV
jgi:hypothetical protein